MTTDLLLLLGVTINENWAHVWGNLCQTIHRKLRLISCSHTTETTAVHILERDEVFP